MPKIQNKRELASRAFAYLRISKAQNKGEPELGLDAQRQMIEEWSVQNKIAIQEWIIDQGVSGSVDPSQRLGFRKVMHALEDGQLDYVVVARLDRLARDAMMTGFIEYVARRNGARILTVEQTPEDEESPEKQLLRQMMIAFAQHERQLIGLRTRIALAQAKKRGRRLGRPQRLATKGNCKLHYVIWYMRKYGCEAEYIQGYLANHCETIISSKTIRRYYQDKGRPVYFPLREVVDVLKPFYRLRMGNHYPKKIKNTELIEWMRTS